LSVSDSNQSLRRSICCLPTCRACRSAASH
jgi:hypothetical protein